MPSVLHVAAFQDNYIWLIRGASRRHVAVVDPGDAEPVLAFLDSQDLTPVAVLCTHHHGDHIGGVADLLARHAIPVYGPANERIRILTHPLHEGDRVMLVELELDFHVLDTPGHTAGHIAYVGEGMLFCGDTLFSAGCGRLFEGTAEQMLNSLSKLRALPEETAVYCAHEYTLSNLRFALTVEPGNRDAREYEARARETRNHGRPTLPSTIGFERRVNPFLRCGEPAVREQAERHVGHPLKSEIETFAAVRRWKDGFRA